MILIMAIVFAVMLVIHWAVSPIVNPAHAARTDPVGLFHPSLQKLSGSTIIRFRDGTRMNRRGRFLGYATKASMARFGIDPGAMFIGDRIESAWDNETKLSKVTEGSMVVVRGPSNGTPTKLRLRKVKRLDRLDDGSVNVVFDVDQHGKEHTERELSSIVARVTHVVMDHDPHCAN